MAEINKAQIKKILEDPSQHKFEKKAHVTKDKKQYTIRIPKRFAEHLELKGNEVFIFTLEEINGESQLTGKLE